MLGMIDVLKFLKGGFPVKYFRIFFKQCKCEAEIIYKI